MGNDILNIIGNVVKKGVKMEITKRTVVKNGYSPEANFKKSDMLIRSKYSASLLENQLLSVSLANCRELNGRLMAVLNKSQIIKLFNVSYHDFYSSLKRAARRMTKIQFISENKELGNFRISNLVTDVEWVEGAGEFKVIFNETFRKEIMDLHINFTWLNLECLCNLDCLGSYRLYEMLQSYCYYDRYYKGIRDGLFDIDIPISELKCSMSLVDLSREEFAKFFVKGRRPDYDEILKLAYELHEADVKKDKPAKDTYPKPKYKTYNDLKRYVLEPACEEITKKTNIDVSFEPGTKARGGKVVSVLFHIKDHIYDKNEETVLSIETPVDVSAHDTAEIDQMLDQVIDIIQEKISINDARTLLKTADYDVEKINKAYSIVSRMDNVKNLIGCMISAIENNWDSPVTIKKKKKNSFKNEMERGYTSEEYNELEKLLVSN